MKVLQDKKKVKKQDEWGKLVKDCGLNYFQQSKIRNYVDKYINKALNEVQDATNMSYILALHKEFGFGTNERSSRISRCILSSKEYIEEAYGHKCEVNGELVYDETGVFRLRDWCERIGVDFELSEEVYG